MRALPVFSNNERHSLCARCGGACCKRAPGIAHPHDFGAPSREKMRAKLVSCLSSGKWAIDWWEGDPRLRGEARLSAVEFVRPAVASFEGKLYHGTWGGPCALLGETGCSLRFAERPFQCRALVPSGHIDPYPGKGCEGLMVGGEWGKREMAVTWIPYQKLLKEVGEEVELLRAEVCRGLAL